MFRVLLLLFSNVFFIASAQKNTTVLVRNDGGEAVEFAYVNAYSVNPSQLLSTNTTDESGKALMQISGYPVLIEITAVGYDPIQYILQTDSVTDLRFTLYKRYNSLKEFVVTGVTTPTRPQDALSNYKVISAATIQSQGAVTLNEVLNNQLNIDIRNDDILGAGIRMQGLSGDKVKTLINSVALNGREGGNIDLGQVNLYNVERIEIVQGPMSIIYGSDALGGVINVIEKTKRKPWEAQAALHYESVGKYNFNLAGTRSLKKHSFTLGGGRNYFRGWKYIDSMVHYGKDTALINRNFLFNPKEQYVANAGYRYTATSGFKLDFGSNFLKELIKNKGQVSQYDPLNGVSATDEYYHTTRSMNRLGLSGNLGATGTWQILNGFVYYKRVRNTYVKDLATLDQTLAENEGLQDTSVFNDVSSRGMYSGKMKKYEFTLGYDVTLQNGKSQKIEGGTHQISDYAAFGLFTVPFLEKERLKLQGGVRASYNTQFGSPIVPALNILFNAAERLQFRASYARGYRVPSLKEMYLTFNDQNHDISGNANLKAETGHHGQLSSSFQLYQKQSDYSQLLITGYYNNVSNGIVLVPVYPNDPNSIIYTYGNLTRQENAIATAQFEGQLRNLHYMLGYSYNYTLGQSGYYDAFNVQEVNSNLSYYLKVAKVNFSLFYKYVGSQPFLRTGIDGTATYEGRQPDYQMLDASLDRKFLNKRVQLTFGVKNILDVQTLTATGLSVGGIHSGNGNINFLPRSLFTTLRFTLD